MRERLVVIGNGMAATRLCEELVSHGYAGSITVLGDEPGPAYNRILLSAVLEGTHSLDALTLRDPEWHARHGIDLRLGARVLELDLGRGEVMLVDGTRFGFDKVVLATGAIPTLPPIRGLVGMDGQLHPKVHAFRSLADCLRLMGSVPAAQRAVVVGGGLLGLQVARALSVRGIHTEVVEGAEHLLSRQVDARGGSVLRRSLRKLGTEVYTGTRAVRLTDEGVQLDNGHVLDTDLVVLTAGGRPSTALARAAGLRVRRGIVVDEHLASVTDPRVHAIGDCAEFNERSTGFVAPAWEQAEVLAGILSAGSTLEVPTYAGTRTVARLRATGLDVAVLGDPEKAEGEVVEVTNPVVGSHRKLVVHGGVITAGALVGDLSRIGLITQFYDRGTVLGEQEPGVAHGGAARGRTGDAARRRREVCACAGCDRGCAPRLPLRGGSQGAHPRHHRLRRVHVGRRAPRGHRRGRRHVTAVSEGFPRCYKRGTQREHEIPRFAHRG
ncbi:NAD(P)/FAD-dependent oxidoreductase [Nocardioides alcanivorans]|uniref:NAD(P)/FAD-dependent oxidoreductase n=1 Tax=Nocardioides alcanivorans TaxID=2897352 RepID=UPI001F3BE41D|nr:FAD-dependent oxidoreductase [Nocardioides alcanivorans]